MRESGSRRPGFSLTELLVVIVLLGLVGGAISRIVVRQQRFYRGANQILDTRSQIRQAATILPLDLRGLSSVGGDVSALGPTSLTFRSNIGSSVLCQKVAAAQVALPPDTVASGTAFSAFLSAPTVGDTVFFYDEGPEMGGSDDTWVPYRITAVDRPLGTVCTSTYANVLSDAARGRYRVTLHQPLSATIKVGAPIRFMRRVRYQLYQAADTKWYLGYEQYTGGAWGGMQPVSGPYRPANVATPGLSGVQFRYFDDAGTELTTVAGASRIARIDVVVRGESQQPIALTGDRASTFRDSLAITVAIRNRN